MLFEIDDKTGDLLVPKMPNWTNSNLILKESRWTISEVNIGVTV
jgi:hypothetical protein